ncbi:FtsW/RodA/SpoVE family cell cycle protein [Mucilaginibacter sp. RS28]|uniref:FtsW/RodA/SpoVE family cell cycle protein n=1 Tax=Mucilaginibacter straminoryzae TaxID=2932774 RepID=A0A9X2BE47_9SPHI|nr:FtsW/RodA/SpoVE family cell cycle protein [Mucilaginibacter straminoryzae]MCJ8211038.1 FtsW/RodA/SpoVE family cell cycle protein [Mucilaginibacter straminoryzae]
MEQHLPQKPSRIKERIFLLLGAIVLGLLFYELFGVQQRNFTDVGSRLREGTMVNLNGKDPSGSFRRLLEKGYYFDDKKDIDLIETAVAKGMKPGEQFDNIGELNKKSFFIDADEAWETGGQSFKKRVEASRALLGYSGDDSVRFVEERNNPPQLADMVDAAAGHNSITASVSHEKAPVAGVLMRLRMVLPQDSIVSDDEDEDPKTITENTSQIKRTYALDSAKHKRLQSFAAYARTNSNGEVVFKNLPDGKAYQVLPLQPGSQFGKSQGVQELDEDVSLAFRQSPHTVRLLSTRDFNILKKEKSLIIRTPQQFNRWYWIVVAGFFAAFLIVHVILSIRFPEADLILLPVLMILTGLSFLTLLSIQDPLRDRFLARDTLYYFGAGMFGIVLLQFFNIRRLTPDSGLYRLFVFKNVNSAAKGWPWIVIAMGLLALLVKFGTGPEGSGVKVNLFGFQPSEFVKYLAVLFLAGFLAANERFISEYPTFKKRLTFFGFALAAIVTTLLLFLVLGDLGPAMVVCFTFIILFSFSRGDFLFMAGSVVLYVLLIWGLKNVWLSTLITAVILTLLMLFKRKQLSESAIMTLVIMAAFLTIDQVPGLDKYFSGPVQRLKERKAIWQDPWNNEVYGGDQVANGLWAMSSGGITGQGAGESFAKTIPEAHTDMILPSIGEEFGWTGIVCVFILFLILLHRAIIIGRQSGTPFLFYLCGGIGICTFVQFLLIAGGSTGALPLSGVVLPFESYGGSSLIANLVAVGFLLSASRVKGTPVQMAYITQQQDRNLVPALMAACVGLLLLTVSVSRYLFNNKKWVVQPALVADRSGARMFSYNPRIAILMNRLQAGSLYDRNGLILATSNPQLIRKQIRQLESAGVTDYNLDSATHKRLDRYYPFEEQAFFWTGDANTGVFNGSTNGYFAEYEHAAELRGFKTPVTSYNVTATRFQEDRFLPRNVREMTVAKTDYSAIAPLLLAGINSKEVDAFKKRNRDVQLTVDAGLQTNIQQMIAADDSLKNNRVSVVVMEAETGDVLASAVYPLPPVKNWEQLTMSQSEQNAQNYWMTTADLGFTYATPPGSTAKVLTAMAAFNKMGIAAKDRTFEVEARERIRTKGLEPDETGTITMERAIAKSNNVYFIKLANEEHLQEDMATLYMKTGMFLHGVGGYFYAKRNNNEKQEEKWRELWRKTEFNTKPRYDPNNIRRTRAKGISGMAWGQGELIATPAAVARLASGVANNGTLMENRYVLKVSDSTTATRKSSDLAANPQYAQLLRSYMIEQSAPKVPILGISVAGKTGTPERIWKGEQINDGWYVFFAPKANGKGNIVTCIRVEKTRGSSNAVHAAGKDIVPLLLKRGYIKNITEGASSVSSRVGMMKAVEKPEEEPIEPDTTVQ